MNDILVKYELDILACGGWGTINSHSITSASALAKYVKSEYGLLCHSADAAYEALLRQFGAMHGTSVIVGEVSWPADSLVAVCVGAAPIFAPVCSKCGMIKPKAVAEILAENKNVKCIILDIIPEKLGDYKLDKLYEIAKANGAGLIINAGGYFSANWNGKPLSQFCDALLYSHEEGSEIFCIKGGFIATNYEPIHSGAFAYHNCGRSFGEGCSLEIDGIVGGDLRVTEFTAVIAEHILETGAFAKISPRVLEPMANQPVFTSDYAKKMTE